MPPGCREVQYIAYDTGQTPATSLASFTVRAVDSCDLTTHGPHQELTLKLLFPRRQHRLCRCAVERKVDTRDLHAANTVAQACSDVHAYPRVGRTGFVRACAEFQFRRGNPADAAVSLPWMYSPSNLARPPCNRHSSSASSDGPA